VFVIENSDQISTTENILGAVNSFLNLRNNGCQKRAQVKRDLNRGERRTGGGYVGS